MDNDKDIVQQWRLRKGYLFLRNRFIKEWQKIPEIKWKTWSIQFTIGWIICCIIMTVLSLVLQKYEYKGLLTFDKNLLDVILKNSFITFDYAIWIETPGNAVFQIPVAVIGVVFAIIFNKPLRAITILASYLLGSLIALIGWLSWARMRPDFVYNGIASPGLHSFPSGHIILLIGVFGYLIYLWIRNSKNTVEKILGILILIIITFLVALSRLVLGAHWPTDIFAGIFIGTLWLFILIIISEKYNI